MWKPATVLVRDVVAEVLRAESEDVATVGEADIIVSVQTIELTLCHESDLHVQGDSAKVNAVAEYWLRLGHSPYQVWPGSSRSRVAELTGAAGDA